jgi:hypothetical protein
MQVVRYSSRQRCNRRHLPCIELAQPWSWLQAQPVLLQAFRRPVCRCSDGSCSEDRARGLLQNVLAMVDVVGYALHALMQSGRNQCAQHGECIDSEWSNQCALQGGLCLHVCVCVSVFVCVCACVCLGAREGQIEGSSIFVARQLIRPMPPPEVICLH